MTKDAYKKWGKKANVKHRFGEPYDYEKYPLERVNERFNEQLQQQIDGKLPIGHIYKMGKPGKVLLSTGVPNLPIQMNAKRLQIKATSYGHDFNLSEVKDLVKALQRPLAVFDYGDKSKAQNIIIPLQKGGKNFIVGLSLNPMVGGRKLEINSIRNVFPKNNSEWLNWISQGKTLYMDKEKIQTLIDQQRTNLADVDYLDLDYIANVIRNFENPKVSDENVADDGIKLSLGDGGSRERKQMDEAKMVEMVERVKATGESLGGAEAHVYTSFVDVPEEYKKEVKKGARGWYDPETHTVHVYLPNCASGDEAQRTVFHEKIGHEGIEVLFGGEEGVKDFAKFVFSSCGKEIREKVMEIADQYDPEWKHPDRTNVGTQEYIAKLAENGPQTAEEFSLWRKIKHYLIKAMKKLGLTIRGLMNDKDLRYYLLRAQQSLHVWDKMPEAKKRAMAEQASETEMKESLSNRPRKRKNETTAQYIERLRQWEKWKIALDKASVSNDPLPEEETYHDKWDKQYRTDMEAWRKANGIAEGAEGPSEAPKRAEGESPQEYALRVADHERELDLWQGAPDYFSYLKKAQEDYRKAYEAWKERYDIDEMENVDLQLYGGETPTEGPADEEAYQEQEDQYQLLIILICTLLPL